MTRYVAVLPLVPMEVGDAFSVSAWPLHVTIVSNFTSELAAAEIGELFTPALSAASPLDLLVGEPALFGAWGTVEVALVTASPTLTALHESLVAVVQGRGDPFDTPDFLLAGYRPHITATKYARATAGDRVHLTQLALVDMAPLADTNGRAVVWADALGI